MSKNSNRNKPSRSKKKRASGSSTTAKNPKTHNMLEQAIALIKQNELVLAEEICRNALVKSPKDPDSLHLLGHVLSRQNSHKEAIKLYHKAIKLHPRFYGALNNLGISQNEIGEFGHAIDSFEKAIDIDPSNPDTYNNLANACKALGKLDSAISNYKKALELNPGHIQALANLGNTYNMTSNYGEACKYLKRALDLDPDNRTLFNNLSLTLRTVCNWKEYGKYRRIILERAQNNGEIPPFYLLPWVDDPEVQYKCARNFTQQVTLPNTFPIKKPVKPRRQDERIKIGYISKDFGNHVVALLTVELFELHSRDKFEVFGFALGRDDGSNMRRHLNKAFDHFIDVSSMDDSDVANIIADHDIQILVDLGGYAMGTQPRIMAMRPAPIQVSYLGYIGTMGASFIDYIIADRHNVPDRLQLYFAEKLLHLPCYMTHDRRRAVSDRTPARAELGLPDEGFIFCCFNNAYKVTPDIFDIWMRCLEKVPGSILWLVDECETLRNNLRKEAQDRGTAPERLIFAPRIDAANHLARMRVADLFLDTLPYNAGATACDALWIGLPVLTCPGNSFVSRMGGSLVHAAGLPELVVDSLDQYEMLAVKLAKEPELLSSLHHRLISNRETSLLFDNEKFRDNIEEAFLKIWEEWCHEPQGEATPAGDSDRLKALQQKAVTLHQQGKLDQAESVYREILSVSPQQAEAINLLGVINAQRGKTDDAIALYRQAIEVNPQLFSAYNNLGVALYNGQKLQEAADCFSQSATISSNADAYYNLGNCLYGLQRYQEAIDNYMRTLEINPGHEQARRNLNASYKQLET